MKQLIVGITLLSLTSLMSCKKCSECHYDGASGEVELGEYCGNELENLENSGYTAADTTYEVHCHEH